MAVEIGELIARNPEPLRSTTELKSLPPPTRAGKVRDIFDLGDSLLLVATDKISISDVVLPTSVPGKGATLTQMSARWFRRVEDRAVHHMLSTDLKDLPEPYRSEPRLEGRVMYVKKARRLDVEAVARGYLTGSGLKDYKNTGEVCGNKLPGGLVEASELPEPIFTPATKEDGEGKHDRNISFEEMVDIVGDRALASQIRGLTLDIYSWARSFARERGIIIADTKLEFGLIGNLLIVIDELLTPDSSRFWPADQYRVGEVQPSLDKQPVRDYGASIGWNGKDPGPELPDDVVSGTQRRYIEAYNRLIV